MKEAPRIIFLGTPEFAVASLEALVKNGYCIPAVVTAPDQPSGRGQQLKSPPVKDFAMKEGITVLQPGKLKNPEFLKQLQSFHADLFIVVAFRMLPELVWKMPPLGTFNLHASLLPQYRGAAPINHAIINGETETGLTTFFLSHEIDTGGVIFQEKMQIFPEETAGELHDRMMHAGAGLVLKTVRAITEGTVKVIEQETITGANTILKPAPKIFREHCRIDWNLPTEKIINLIRGLSPYPAAYTTLTSPSGESHTVKIYRALKSPEIHPGGPGTIITDGKKRLAITCNDGTVDLVEIQQAGKRAMETEEFLRGFRINSDWMAG